MLAYIPDHEPALGPCGLPKDVKWLSGSDLATSADVLLHDAQYTGEEYKIKVGWGHCAMEDAIQYAAQTGVRHLLLTHHDPTHTDAQLHSVINHLKASASSSLSYELAVEGLSLKL